MLLVDDDHPDIGQRRDHGQPCADHDVGVAGPDPSPLVGALPFSEPGVDERDPGVEVGPQPVDEREGEGDLGHEHEGRPPGFERGGDRLDVDRGLAAAGHAIEQERARVPGGDGSHDPVDRLGLGGQEVARGGTAATPAGGSLRQWSARALADLGFGESASDEPGSGGRSVTGSQLGRRQFPGRCRPKLRQ